MCKCGNLKCKGFYLLHPAEMKDIPQIKENERLEDASCTFELKDSPSSGEVFTKFKELHVIAS